MTNPVEVLQDMRDQERRRILEMKPGREMDREVAVKIFEVDDPDPRWSPSTDITASWEVVEKMLEWGGCEIGVYGNHRSKSFVVHTYTDTAIYQRGISVTASSAPEAISKAALLARLDGQD